MGQLIEIEKHNDIHIENKIHMDKLKHNVKHMEQLIFDMSNENFGIMKQKLWPNHTFHEEIDMRDIDTQKLMKPNMPTFQKNNEQTKILIEKQHIDIGNENFSKNVMDHVIFNMKAINLHIKDIKPIRPDIDFVKKFKEMLCDYNKPMTCTIKTLCYTMNREINLLTKNMEIVKDQPSFTQIFFKFKLQNEFLDVGPMKQHIKMLPKKLKHQQLNRIYVDIIKPKHISTQIDMAMEICIGPGILKEILEI